MAASNQKTIVVIGATGNQGGSVARTFLGLPHWKVRAVTRNPSSPAAQTLASSGAEVVQGDLSDIGSLSPAFQDANAIFLNTDFWETYKALAAKLMADGAKLEGQPDPSEIALQTEVSYGKNAAQAAARVPTLERLVYSAFPSMKKLTGGKYHSNHWESKAAVAEYIETELPDLAKKTSYVYLGAYNTNAFLAPTLDPSDGQYKYITPLATTSRMPIIDPTKTTGVLVRALVEDEEAGMKLFAYDTDSYLTVQEICDIWSRASGREASIVNATVQFLHEKFGVPMEVLEAVPALNEFGYTGSLKFTEPSDLKTKVKSTPYEEWMKGRDWNAILKAK
ncbi:hypothetical protein BP6252_07557 [Coleophoma cylindrospora]|uniref:NmrA-like domain-containing protein n=1 Tax=Coleophoma cylindrospora TaxID=1849047 RepID=A0A3D8RAV5_9HELO|nr:hypothetical protein BP6252_07557 [Coleophoma cylindrospora]